MKKALLILTATVLTTLYTFAQQNGVAAAAAAQKALTAYNLDPSKSDKLKEAINLIEKALKSRDAQNLSSAWLTKAEIYNTRLQMDMAKKIIDPNAKLSDENDALISFEAYKKCLSLSDKKSEKTDALKGIGEVQAHLLNTGLSKYGTGAYETSFLYLRAALESHGLLKTTDRMSLLDEAKELEDHLYFTGIMAKMVNRCSDAVGYFDKLYRAGTDKPGVYQNLYECRSAMGEAASASKILTEGRNKFPEDPGLLFAEINEYLQAGKFNESTSRLKAALALEPENTSLYVTLGNVYDNLYQAEQRKNNERKADEYFEEAKKYYFQAIAKDPESLDANYSVGALYYNMAASRTQALNETEDLSAAGMKKYEKLKAEIMDFFNLALPYFKKAESLDPNDLYTLTALSEIFTRKDDALLASEMKKRLTTVKSGGSNRSSYFH